MTYIEFAVVREAHKIETIKDYHPENSDFIVNWARTIEAREAAGTPRQRPAPTRNPRRDSPPRRPARTGISAMELDRESAEWLERKGL